MKIMAAEILNSPLFPTNKTYPYSILADFILSFLANTVVFNALSTVNKKEASYSSFNGAKTGTI